MPLSPYNRYIVSESSVIKDFVCDDQKLKKFLLEDSINYSRELLATTYVFEDNNQTVAYFSIFNDNLRVEDMSFASKGAFKRFLASLVSHPKRHLEYFPAMKVGRLAVATNLRGQRIGEEIIRIIIGLAIKQNDVCACKVITVDAYANQRSLNFYTRMGFEFLSNKINSNEDDDDETDGEEIKPTKPMYLNLTPYINTYNGLNK